MFHSARLKLTAWYLVIIMTVALVFSAIIYQVTTMELERGYRRFQMQLNMEEFRDQLPPRFQPQPLADQVTADLELAKHIILFRLATIDLAILFVSAVAGYFLAGKTLSPIEIALEEQKRFVADASHELRTPLTALKTSVEVTLRQKQLKPKEARKVLADCLEDIDNLDLLSSSLLRLSRYQTDGGSLHFKPVEIEKVINKAVFQIKPLIQAKKIKLKVKVESGLVLGDFQALLEVVLVLLDNAIKYSESLSHVWVNVTANQKQVVIEVRDEGRGIEKEDLPHIFDRFFRVDQSRSNQQVSGFGIGLSLAKRIVRLHRGKIEVASQIGVGSSFKVKLAVVG